MKKKIIIVVSIAALLITAASFYRFNLLNLQNLEFLSGKNFYQADANNAELSISGGGEKAIGTSFNLSLNLNSSGNAVTAVEVIVTYPDNLLTLNSVTKGSRWSLEGNPDGSDNPGSIHRIIGSIVPVSDNALVYTINFTAKAEGNCNITIAKAVIANEGNTSVGVSISNGSVSIVPAALETPPQSNTNTPAPGTTNNNSNRRTTTNRNSNVNANTSTAPAAVVLKDPALVKVEYSPDAILDPVLKQVKGIVFSGTADADAKVNITILSDPIAAFSQADANGDWSYTLSEWFPEGVHKITLSSEKDGAKSQDVTSDFIFSSSGKDQIAMGNTLMPKDQVAVPASKSKKSWFTTKNITVGIIVLSVFLTIVLMLIFYFRRKHYLKVANDIGHYKSNGPADAKSVSSEQNVQYDSSQKEELILPTETTPPDDVSSIKVSNVKLEKGESIIPDNEVEKISPEKNFYEHVENEPRPEDLSEINPILDGKTNGQENDSSLVEPKKEDSKPLAFDNTDAQITYDNNLAESQLDDKNKDAVDKN